MSQRSSENVHDESNNELTEFPREALKNSKLISLNLSNNRIDSLPSVIQALHNLVILNLSHNCLKDLPSELGRLSTLESLDLSHNEIEHLPGSLTILRNLQYLNISHNQISALPADFGSLSQLYKFISNHNGLTVLPRSIGLCNNASTIDLSYNQLKSLPSELGALHGKLKSFEIKGNPLVDPPKETIDAGTDALLLHLKLNSHHLQKPDYAALGSPQRSRLKQMKVTVVSAHDLVLNAAASSPLSPGVYVELSVENPNQTDKYRTGIAKRGTPPVWNSSFTFIFNAHGGVTVGLYVKMHMSPDILIASAKIPVDASGIEEEISLFLNNNDDPPKRCGHVVIKVAIAGASGTRLQSDTTISSNVSTGTLASIAAQANSVTQSSLSEQPNEYNATGESSLTTPSASRRFMTTPGLPAGWERRQDGQGRTFYVDHNSRLTSWHPPESVSAEAQTEQGPLPDNWEERRDPQGRIYYVDHNTRSTTWHRPTQNHVERVNRFQSRDLRAANTNHELRSLFSGTERSDQDVETIDPETMPLPPFWEARVAANGARYFMNHLLQRTQWTDPRSESAQLPLPSGWTQSVTAEGRVFFIDHNNRRTQFEDPRLEPDYIKQMEKANAEVPKYIRNFRYKTFLFKQTLQQLQHQGEFKLICSRDAVFQDSYEQIINATANTLRRRLMISFHGEEGLDYGGVSREWFFLLSNEMLNPNYCLFEYATQSHQSLKINPESGINPEHLSYFRFVGRVVGLAVFHQKFIDCGFTLPFYKRLLGRPLKLLDMESVDASIYKSLKWLLENDIDDLFLGMTFAADYETFGEIKSVELKPGGNDIEVCDANKAEYIDLMINFRMSRGVEDQMKAFMTGFNEIISLDKLQMFDERELEVMICGVSEIDIDDWEKNSTLRSYTENNKQIRWFWQCLRSWDNEMRVRFLQFVTGSCRVPIGGFKDLQGSNGPQTFCIEKVGDDSWLPRSHTCFNRLDLPPYKSYEQLVQKITLAIEETEGFAQE